MKTCTTTYDWQEAFLQFKETAQRVHNARMWRKLRKDVIVVSPKHKE
jgi:hypothetical protein